MLKGKKKYLHKWIEIIEWIIEWMQKNELEKWQLIVIKTRKK